MKFYLPKDEQLSTTYNDITYTKDYYKTFTSATGIVDESYPNWDSSTTFNQDDYCIVPELKAIYRSAEDNNTDNFPPANPSKWIEWGSVNSYKMFRKDEFIGDKTTGTDVILEFDFSKCDSFAMIGVAFTSCQIELINNDDDSVVFDETIQGIDVGCLSFADYFYKDYTTKTRIVVDGLEWLPNSTLRLTFSGDVSIQAFVYGLAKEMGCTLYGTSLRFESSSSIKKDEITGFRTVYRYGSVRVLEVKISFDTVDFNLIAQNTEQMLDRNIVFVPSESDKFTEMITLGYFTEFEIPVENPTKIETETTIVGVV